MLSPCWYLQGELREAGVNVTVMIQADMLAYRAPGEPLQLGLPDVSVFLLSFYTSFANFKLESALQKSHN
jgi:hypothetical protein